jgi:thiamine kinase-like enzyme
MDTSAWNMYVFRDGRKTVPGEKLVARLRSAIQSLRETPTEDSKLAALVAAGELECALTDCDEAESLASSITDGLAAAFFQQRDQLPPQLDSALQSLGSESTLNIAVAEGFAYYALHPNRFNLPIMSLGFAGPVKVIGLRSIGTTLSAVVVALLRKAGIAAERITVRPTGHPYDRKLELQDHERDWVLDDTNAQYVVVDEGPGLSGSSFLAGAEAIEREGIAPNRIVMLGSRMPDPKQLRAPDAEHRWSRFRFLVADPEPILPSQATVDWSSGRWRQFVLKNFDAQPASWTSMETSKYASNDGRCFFKFHGYGHFGEEIAGRARKLQELGFAPQFGGLERGFGRYRMESGRMLSQEDLSPKILTRMAEYCAVRNREFAAENEQVSDLESMAMWNWECEFGKPLAKSIKLAVKRFIVADAKMQPHEWFESSTGKIIKLDAVTHGDDHFFPGPCDIAWDLAGAIVEWEMNGDQSQQFLERYRDLSGDHAVERLPEYLLAYSIFRMGWTKMAAKASAESFDERLLLRDYRKYRAEALRRAAEWEAKIKNAEKPSSADGLEPAVA